MQERYDGKCRFQIVVNQNVIQQGYTIISTSAFSNRLKYSRYIDENKTIGQIRSGGFDTVMYDKEERLIGAEVRPEPSLKSKRKLKPGELDEQDRADLSLFGSSDAGATLVDSRESTYDSQGGWS